MDYREHYESTKEAILDAFAEINKPIRMMRIDPFEAEDDCGEPIRVIGVYDDKDDMRFIAVIEDGDGEIYPCAVRTVYKAGAASNAQNDSPVNRTY